MKQKIPLMKSCAGLFLFCVLCLITYLIYTTPAQRSASIPLTDLTVRSEVFPMGWEIKAGDDWVPIPEKVLLILDSLGKQDIGFLYSLTMNTFVPFIGYFVIKINGKRA